MLYREIVCLAKSKKLGGICIAGKDLSTGEWIRPVSDREHGELSNYDIQFENGLIPDVLDIITIPLVKELPISYQPENILIDHGHYWGYVDTYDKNLDIICDKFNWLFINKRPYPDRISKNYIDNNSVDGSLSLIKVNDLLVEKRVEFGKQKLRARFSYMGTRFNLAITDLDCISEFKSKEENDYKYKSRYQYLVISLGEPYERDGCCYKLVASVIER